MNAPAERLFNVPATADEAAQRRVRANGAHLTSFVSNVLTTTGEQRYRGEIQLSDPVTGRPLPVEGVAGTILSEQGELMWVVTILHDLTEALEKARLYEQLKAGVGELRAQGPGGDRRTGANRTSCCGGSTSSSSRRRR